MSKDLILNRKIVLASTSPFRRALLSRLGIPFESTALNVDEATLPGESAAATALRLAAAKAYAVRPRFPNALIIGSDQVAELDGQHIGKPGSHDKAVRQLQQMRSKTVVFHTALAVLESASGQLETRMVPTTVSFRPVIDAQIEAYLRREEPYDCAGSAKFEELGIALMAGMEGSDPNALIGPPLIELISLLRNQGVEVI